MRGFFARYGWLWAVVIVAAFAWFAIGLSDPPEEVERESLVSGTLLPADALKPDGPFVPYVGLHAGELPAHVDAVPEFPLDDRQPEGGGAFEMSADAWDGTRFYLLARFETAKQERFCKLVPLPEMRRTPEETWVVAETGEPLEPQRIFVDKSTRCD